MYKVIVRFMDLQDNDHIYEVGDTYPRKGSDPSFDRIRELAGKKNKIGKVLIEEIKEEPIAEEKPKPKKRKKADVEQLDDRRCDYANTDLRRN